MNNQLNAWLTNTRTQQAYRLVKPDTRIGRSPENHIVIVDDPSMSRQHAMIRYQNGVFTLIPLMARMPIQVNEHLVTAPVQLFHNNLILLGQTQIRFLRDSGGMVS